MKKLTVVILSLVLMVAFAMPGYSQMAFKKGVKAGLNIANLGGSDMEGTDSRTAFNFGVFGDFALGGGLVSVQPEVLYSMKGATEKFDVNGTTVDVTYKLTYLEVPVLLKLNVPVQGATIFPTVFAGPALGVKLSSKVKAEGGGQSQEEDLEDIKSTDFSLVLGAGMGFGPVVVDIRYVMGLSSIDDSAADADVKNKVFSINAGVAL